MKKVLLASLMIAAMHVADAQNLKMPVASPRQTVKQEFGLGEINLSYSRPSAKNREIYGGLVPYDAVWRTGANSPTTIEFSTDVIIGGKPVSAGKYGLVTIPGKSSWKIIITKQLDIASPTAYKAENNVAEVSATPKKLANKVETFSINFDNITDKTVDLCISWGDLAVTLPITSDHHNKVMAQIQELMNGPEDKRPYFESAMYYYENNVDLNKAYEWMKKASASNSQAFWIYYYQAKLEQKLGKKADAIATSKKSLDLATKANWPDYIRLNEALLKELQ